MSFKSLKEFGVSAERLGSICKRWMARVQRSVPSLALVSFIYLFKSERMPSTCILVASRRLLRRCACGEYCWKKPVTSVSVMVSSAHAEACDCEPETEVQQLSVHRLVSILSPPGSPERKRPDLLFHSSAIVLLPRPPKFSSICCRLRCLGFIVYNMLSPRVL